MSDVATWISRNPRENRPGVFVWGHPRIAGDSEFGKDTEIRTVPRVELTCAIARLFERHGTEAFALLEGSFSLVLADAQAGDAYLVVDKFGCDDIYVHRRQDSLAFASHPAFLRGAELDFDAQTVAFFLAQDGFVPAPFTLFEGVKTIGRARFLRIRRDGGRLGFDRERYWRPSKSHELRTIHQAVAQLYPLLESAVSVRQSARSGLLLSGGTDSSLLFDMAARHCEQDLIAMTGSIKGFDAGELEIEQARRIASRLGAPHESVVVDPSDEGLPGEWELLSRSWMVGTRATLPVFHRLAQIARNALDKGSSVISGQMADTLADNNYTFPSLGYKFRRTFYSPWFLRLQPFLGGLTPASDGPFGNAALATARRVLGPRLAGMMQSVFGGIKNREEFFDGRVFGFGEMPGRSPAHFPALTRDGFEQVADWYSSQFVAPIVSGLEPETFYRDMLELSLDMVMLHLDTRLVCHAFRLDDMRAELPFLDSRVVNFFLSLPGSARSIFRQPKHVIRAQVRQLGWSSADFKTGKAKKGTGATAKSGEDLLLEGSLGAHFRALLADAEALNRAKGIFEFLDESYVLDQIGRFKNSEPGVSAKFISRLAALEAWSRMAEKAACQESACARA